MVNINMLKGKIVEKGFSIERLAEAIGISKSTLYRKLSVGGETFEIKEADLITETLGLTVTDANAIFFSQFVA